MNEFASRKNPVHHSPKEKSGSVRRGLFLSLLLIAALLVGIPIFFGPEQSIGKVGTSTVKGSPSATHDFHHSSLPAYSPIPPAPTVHHAEKEKGGAPVPAEGPFASPVELVTELTSLNTAGGPVTSEQASTFKKNLAELVAQGSSSVPAIQGFLDKNLDVEYEEVAGGDQLGYPSLRASLFDTLRQIGGPEAEGALLQTLKTTAIPSELLELAKDLDQQAPGQYRDQILNAAQEALNMASANQLGNNAEVGPLFRVFEIYGNQNPGVRDSGQ